MAASHATSSQCNFELYIDLYNVYCMLLHCQIKSSSSSSTRIHDVDMEYKFNTITLYGKT